MKAAQINSCGGGEVLKVIDDVSKPVAGEGQVLVEAYAASLNPFDWKLREGSLKDYINLKFPATLGGDVAGLVVAVGNGVDHFKIGQAVYGLAGAASGQGSLAEYVPAKADQLASKPASLDYLQSAALPLAAASAYQALLEHIDLKSGQNILIHGGAGGIGSLAIQMAKYIGAYVATTVSEADTTFAKNLGADEVIDYKNQDFADQLKNFDAVFDTVGGQTNERSYQVLKPAGKIVSMVADANSQLTERYMVRAIHQNTKVTTAKLEAITKMVDKDKLSVKIDQVFSLDEAAQALEYLKTGHPKGKVVISIKS